MAGSFYIPDWVPGIAVSRQPYLGLARLEGTRDRAKRMKYGGWRKPDTLVVFIDGNECFMDYPGKPGSLAVPGAEKAMWSFLNFAYRCVGDFDLLLSSEEHPDRPTIESTSWYEVAVPFRDESARVEYTSGERLRDNTVVQREWLERRWLKPLFEPEWTIAYPALLEKRGRSPLITWVRHGIENEDGPQGNRLDASLLEFQAFHAASNGFRSWTLYKGQPHRTGMFSIYETEVWDPSLPDEINYNGALLAKHMGYKRTVYAGYAGDKCALATVRTHIEHCVATHQKQRIRDIVVLVDAIPCVVIPGVIDFTPIAMAQYHAWEKEYGLQLMTTWDLIDLLK